VRCTSNWRCDYAGSEANHVSVEIGCTLSIRSILVGSRSITGEVSLYLNSIFPASILVLKLDILDHVISNLVIELIVGTYCVNVDATNWSFSLYNLPLVVLCRELAGTTVDRTESSFNAYVSNTFRVGHVVHHGTDVPVSLIFVVRDNIVCPFATRPSSQRFTKIQLDVLWWSTTVSNGPSFRSQVFTILSSSGN